MVCYYGIYAKHHKQEKNLRTCLFAEKQHYLSKLLDWRNSIILSFGYDPPQMFGVWHFYVGFRGLPQKNCTI